MQAYEVITNQDFLLKHGYLFWKDGEEAAKIIDIEAYRVNHTFHVKVTAETKPGENIIFERSWTEHFNEVVVS